MTVFAHIVTFNSSAYIEQCLAALLSQEGFKAGQGLEVLVTDNASVDDGPRKVQDRFGAAVKISLSSVNLGFAAGHNIGVKKFLDSRAEFFLILNPDLALNKDGLANLVNALEKDPSAGAACAKLFRADENLKPLANPVLDSAGMILTNSLRHFDRGSEELDTGQFDRQEYVFGGTGACLLIRREFVKSLLLSGEQFERDLFRVHPELEEGIAERAPLFDEAFFAYREDADLAWRGKILGWKCLYVPTATGYHVRKVLPERRAGLPKFINLLGVRNRFLLQLNNYSLSAFPEAFFPGIIFRNLVVVAGVLFKEWSSIPALLQAVRLMPRAFERRKILFSRKEKNGI